MNEYRIEYSERGIPGILYIWVWDTKELLVELEKLKFRPIHIDFDTVKVYRN